jgi:hypothetical protein
VNRVYGEHNFVAIAAKDHYYYYLVAVVVVEHECQRKEELIEVRMCKRKENKECNIFSRLHVKTSKFISNERQGL